MTLYPLQPMNVFFFHAQPVAQSVYDSVLCGPNHQDRDKRVTTGTRQLHPSGAELTVNRICYKYLISGGVHLWDHHISGNCGYPDFLLGTPERR